MHLPAMLVVVIVDDMVSVVLAGVCKTLEVIVVVSVVEVVSVTTGRTVVLSDSQEYDAQWYVFVAHMMMKRTCLGVAVATTLVVVEKYSMTPVHETASV